MSMLVALHSVHFAVHRSVDHSQRFYRYHRPFQRHCTTVPLDYSENYCNRHLGFVDDAVAVVAYDVDAVDTECYSHQRQCNDYCDKQHLDYYYCAVAVADTVVHFVRSVEHNCHIDRSTWVDYSDAVQQQQCYLRDCEHFAKRYYECYFVAHNFVTDSCLDYDDYCVLGMVVVVVVVVVVGIFVDSLVVYADDFDFDCVMRTIVNYLVRAPDSIVVDWVMEVVNDCFVRVVVLLELVTASMVVGIVIMIRPLAFQRSIQIHCLWFMRCAPTG